MEIYLIRHALPSPKNYGNEFPGPNLGKEGLKQAHRIAAFLKDKAIVTVYASDYNRVRQTATPFLDAAKVLNGIHFEHALRERNSFLESHESLHMRVNKWFENITQDNLHGNIAIFSHCGPINMILDIFDPKQSFFLYPFCDDYQCRTPIAGVWRISTLNTTEVSGKLFQL